jgi:hypothetical protein
MSTSVSLTSLWLPILLSAVTVFVLSNVIHMVLKYHANDYSKFPQEDQVMEALRKFNIPPGDYMLPRPASMDDVKSPAFAEKMNKGPVMVVTVKPNGPMTMGPYLVQWFLYTIVASIFAGYMGTCALKTGADYLHVFQVVGCAAFMGYGLALWQQSIWYNKSWSTTIRGNIDALIYGLFTAGMFGWLWPK